MAVVAASATFSWCRPDIRIKWPNDVYADGQKVCGVLCEATVQGTSHCEMYVGIGVNVFNERPTVGLSKSSIEQVDHNARETFITALLIHFERLYDQYCTSGFVHSGLLQTYLQSWMHDGQRVRLGGPHGPHALVKGLAPNGWVRVYRLDWNAFQDLPPDTTSLDMLNGILFDKPLPT